MPPTGNSGAYGSAIAGVGGSALDAPPPGPGTAAQPQQTIRGLVPPRPQAGNTLPPDVLKGLMTTAQSIGATLQSMAQITRDPLPKAAAGFGMVQDLLESVMAQLLEAGGGPVSATAPGPSFPGGGSPRPAPGS